MTENYSYINELVRANLKLLVDDNLGEVLKYLSLKGYRITKPPKEIKDEYTFEKAWNLYQKKVGDKARLLKKWNSMPLQDRKAATEYIPAYVLATPDKQYRKHFQTFLNQRSWEDELIGATPPPATPTPSEEQPIGERWKEVKQHQDEETQITKERERILGLIQLIQTNPRSSARKSLMGYYRRGYLQELGIQWNP